MTLETICSGLGLCESKILNCYTFGSRVYETHSPNSDYDFIIVYENSNNEILEFNKTHLIYDNDQADDVWNKDGSIQATLYSITKFQQKLNLHHIECLECIFLPLVHKLKETIQFDFTLDLEQLRRSISTICSNSWVKCKKKMEIEWKNDLNHSKSYYEYIGKKSLFHSLRIGMYGIQIAKLGMLNDYIQLDEYYKTYELYNEIMNMQTWDELKAKYQSYANNIRTQFRMLCPLSTDIS